MERIVSFTGAFLKHIIGVMLLCWRRMLWAALISFALGVTLAMLVAVVATGRAFPGALALVVALLFGAALAYGVALTVFIEEFLLGVADIIRLLEGDARAAAHITATVAEREVGDVTHGLRRLIGLASSQPAPSPTLPTLPAMPRYPANSARPGAPAHPVAREAALAGASALAATVIRSVATRDPQPALPQPAVAPLDPDKLDKPDTAPDALGSPVRADRLPRIGWTYEHEAIRPVRPTPPPDTLAELAGAAVVAGAGEQLAQRGTPPQNEPAPADEAARIQVTPVAPAEPAPAEPEPLDVTVVATSATNAGDAAVTSPAQATTDDAPLDDERLAEPLALTLPDEAQPTVVESAAVEPVATPLDLAMLAPAPATTPLPQDEPQDEPQRQDEPLDEPQRQDEPLDERQDEPLASLDPAMLAPVPATIPLLAEEDSPLDPAMLTPAPTTTPLAFDEVGEVGEAPLDAAMLAPAPATTPLQVEAAPAAEEAPATPEITPEDAPAGPVSDVPEQVEQMVQSEPVADVAAEPSNEDIAFPAARPAFARVTRPVAEIESSLDAISRATPPSGPRPSAPESSLWERLSQALIDRSSGMPSSPFAAPHPSPSDVSDAPDASAPSDGEETPQA